MFGDGLDGWMIGGGFQAEVTGAHRHDYTATAAGGVATVAAAVPAPTATPSSARPSGPMATAAPP